MSAAASQDLTDPVTAVRVTGRLFRIVAALNGGSPPVRGTVAGIQDLTVRAVNDRLFRLADYANVTVAAVTELSARQINERLRKIEHAVTAGGGQFSHGR